MANIKISDLPPIALPLDGDNTFFEVQTIAAGEDVSRKVSVNNLFGGFGLDASFLTVSANAQLPNERVLTEGTNITFVDSGPNGTLTINVTGGGFGDVFKVGTPVDNQIGVWTGDGTIEGDPNFTWDGSQLLVPQADVPAAPTVGFGDGDTGFYESADDVLGVAIGGINRWEYNGNQFRSDQISGGPALVAANTSANSPTVLPHQGRTGSGLASGAANQVELVADGETGISYRTLSGEVTATNKFADGIIASTTQTQFQGQLNSSYNEVITVANPNDVVTAPQKRRGMQLVIVNRGANVLQVFPSTNDDFGNGPNNSTTIAAGESLIAVGGAGSTGQFWDVLFNGPSTGGGDVIKVGTPVNNQIGVWTGDGTIEGDPNFEWDGVTNTLTLVGSPVNIEGSNLYRFDGGILLDGGSVTTFNFSSLFGGIQDHGFVLGASGINFLHNISGTPFVLSGDYTRFEVDRPIRVTNDANVDWMDQFHDGTDYNFDAFQTADVNFTGLTGRILQGAETLAFVSEIVVPDPLLLSSGGAGVPTYSFAADTDTGVYNPALDILGLTAGGVLGLSLAEAGSHVIQTNEEHVGLTASVTQTQAGGLALLSSYNEIAIVGTTGDALTAFGVAVGERLIVINNGANDLQLFPAVGDNIGAGVDASITIAVGEIGIFIGRDLINWDTLYNNSSSGSAVDSVFGRTGAVVALQADYDAFYLVKAAFAAQSVASDVTFDGKVTFTDVTGVQFDPSVEIDMRNPADDTTFFMQYVAAGVNWGLAGADFNSVFMDFGASFTHFRFGDPILMTERAAAVADVAALGQFWVRDDVPNTPMFTDDVGTDFVLNDSGIAVSGTPVNNQLAIWTGANALEGDSQVTWDGTTLRIFESTVVEAIEITPNLITPIINFSGATSVSFTGPSSALGYFFDQGARFGNTLRINTTTPALVFEIATVERASMVALATSFTMDVGGQTSGNLFQINDSLVTMLSVDATNGLRVFETGAEVDYIETRHDGVDGNITVFNGLDLNFIGASVGYKFDESVYVTEKAAANADFAGLGQFWVRNDVPNIPMFTDDVGTDFKLGVANDAVQARRTTSYTLTTAFADVTLDTTDIETDSTIIEHSGIATDNIEALVAGTYEFTYGADIDPSAAGNDNIRCFGRMRLNDLGVDIPGSLASQSAYEDASTIGNQVFGRLQCSFIVVLAAADIVTLQLMKVETGGTGIFTAEEVTVTAKRLL